MTLEEVMKAEGIDRLPERFTDRDAAADPRAVLGQVSIPRVEPGARAG